MILNKVNKRLQLTPCITIGLCTLLMGCRPTTKDKTNMEEQKNESTKNAVANNNTPKVTGIGGIFFFSENPKDMKEWYAKNLGLEINAWGTVGFESRNLEQPEVINNMQWSPFKKGSDYFAPSKKEFMINYRVQNIEGLVEQFKQNGVTVLDSIATYEYGKFVHIMDTEGNKIELWEPAGEDRREIEPKK